MPLGTDIWSGLSREWQFEPQLPEWEEGINCSSLLRILPPTIQQSKAYVRHVDNITNFWRIQFLSRHSSVGVQRDQKWTLRAVLSEFDEGHSTMRILSRCVYTVHCRKKSENGRLFQNDKFYFNFTVWTFNGKDYCRYMRKVNEVWVSFQMIKCARK